MEHVPFLIHSPWHVCQTSVSHMRVVLFLSPLFCSIDLHVLPYANATASASLQLDGRSSEVGLPAGISQPALPMLSPRRSVCWGWGVEACDLNQQLRTSGHLLGMLGHADL